LCLLLLLLQVSSPQLSLLEATLASMTRVDAFIMMRQQRSPGNVFEEANRCGRQQQQQQRVIGAAAAAAVRGSQWQELLAGAAGRGCTRQGAVHASS
jgi:hypothetical protein